MSLAAFDSGFFKALPEVAATYGLPAEMARSLGLRRLGFHGLAHRSMWQSFRARAAGALGRVISLQLGGGCSAAALRDGQPVETSMGFSPLEGLMMATRPGDLDAGALLHLMEQRGLGPAEMRDVLYRQQRPAGRVRRVRLICANCCPRRRRRRRWRWRCSATGSASTWVPTWRCWAAVTPSWWAAAPVNNLPVLRQRIFAGLEALGIVLDAQANQRAQGAGGDQPCRRRPCRCG